MLFAKWSLLRNLTLCVCVKDADDNNISSSSSRTSQKWNKFSLLLVSFERTHSTNIRKAEAISIFLPFSGSEPAEKKYLCFSCPLWPLALSIPLLFRCMQKFFNVYHTVGKTYAMLGNQWQAISLFPSVQNARANLTIIWIMIVGLAGSLFRFFFLVPFHSD